MVYILILSSLSKGGLAKQNYDKFTEYALNGEFVNIKPFLISSEVYDEERLFIPTNYNVYCLPTALNKKDGNILKSGAFENFLKTMTDYWSCEGSEITMGLNKSIYLIKDECHIATKNLDKINKYFTKIFNFSATPKLERGQIVNVEITNEEAESCKLIKKIEKGAESDTIEDAVKKFKEIKEKYIENLGVNPCLIIQISNKDKADEELAEIKPVLNDNDLKWILIVDKDKECDTNDVFKIKKLPVYKWRDYAKNNSSSIDVIIFKLAISEGWDIPRACMLYQKRDVHSEQLTQQVVGRVRRNPRLLDYEDLPKKAQELAMTAWIWGDIEKDGNIIYQTKLRTEPVVRREIRLKTTRIKKLVNREKFDLNSIIGDDEAAANNSIFELYKRYKNSNQSIQKECDEYSDTPQKWWKFNEKINEISTKYNSYICNYDDSMELTTDENGKETLSSFPIATYYVDTENKTNISNCVWVKVEDSTKFAFDSEAEREWVEVLKDLCSISIPNSNERIIKATMPNSDFEFLWGKNYLPNSEIKYEYYLNGRHFSYPDFVMKDSFNNIHIFEVKSINKSGDLNIDEDEYLKKINELKKCYKKASELTGDIFYLPLKVDNDWQITRFKNGVESVPFDLYTFKNHLKNNT